jgi:hypothetical protein
MRIIVNHLTRMQAGYVCVAGINVQTFAHVRPVLSKRLSVDLLASRGGVFALGTIVDLGHVTRCGSAPEVEDHQFHPRNAKSFREMSPKEFWDAVDFVAVDDLAKAFGSDLHAQGRTCAVDQGRGSASLACVRAREVSLLWRGGVLRARISVGDIDCQPPVTDLRFFEEDHKTVKWAFANQVNMRLQQGVRVVLAAGLSRAWMKDGDTEARHWLQVNNLHLEDDPLWQA